MKSSRRNFILNNFSLACLVSMAGSRSLCARDFTEREIDSRNRAEHIMVFASPYSSQQWQYLPHMHQQIKENIEQLSEGRIFVEIRDGGQAGVGTELMAQVSRGHVSAALVSASNLSRAAPELDILNIPFWAAENQQYLNLVTSPTWRRVILNKIAQQGRFEVMFPYIVGARTAASTKTYNKRFSLPTDLQEVIFRIPASKVLNQFYQLLDTQAVNVPWKEVAGFSRKNLIHAMDPCISGLYGGPDNLRTQIGIISEIESVHDGWMAVMSQKWRNTLPPDLQEVVKKASEITFKQQLAWSNPCVENCRKAFSDIGVGFYTPNAEEKAQWRQVAGHQRAEWTAVKKQILGNAAVFDELLEATQSNHGYSLSAVKSPSMTSEKPRGHQII